MAVNLLIISLMNSTNFAVLKYYKVHAPQTNITHIKCISMNKAYAMLSSVSETSFIGFLVYAI